MVGTRHSSRLPQAQATSYQGIRIAPLFMELEGDSGPMPEDTNEILQDVVDYMNTGEFAGNIIAYYSYTNT